MTYRLQKTELVGDGIRRIVLEEIGKALAGIDDVDGARQDAVHEVRKHCKKVRGAMRLLRGSFDGYSEENARVRDVARLLSAARDAKVLRETQRQLIDELGYPSCNPAVTKLDEALASRALFDGSQTDIDLRTARDRLAAIAADAAHWQISRDEFDAVAGGLQTTYERARKAERRCLDDPSTGNLHEWRKAVKYHWCHLRLVAGAWPKLIKARQVAARHLSGLLGDDHDLAVYQQALDEAVALPRKLSTRLREHIALQRRLLQQESFSVGARLFAGKPRDFVRRLEACWEAWRRPGVS